MQMPDRLALVGVFQSDCAMTHGKTSGLPGKLSAFPLHLVLSHEECYPIQNKIPAQEGQA